MDAASLLDSVTHHGFAMVATVLSPAEIRHLSDFLGAVDGPAARRRGGTVYARRNLLDLPPVRALADAPAMRALVEPVLSADYFPVRGLLFDKTPLANWKVAWHQDRAIAVRERVDLPGFGPWSVKAGVLHVEPPVDILERMLAVRLHLDHCGEDNGPLRVLPGSHAWGRLDATAVHRLCAGGDSLTCPARAGDALLMRPLLLHASSAARRPHRRRVLHLEFAAAPLPLRSAMVLCPQFFNHQWLYSTLTQRV